MLQTICGNEHEMHLLGMQIAKIVSNGDTVLLDGEMGAGKSVFTRGIAEGLGILEPIPSPTFTILNIHEGPGLSLYHFDLYRLESEEELLEMGLDEMIPPDSGVCVIEWPERCAAVLPRNALKVQIEYMEDEQNPDDANIRMVTFFSSDRFSEEKLSEMIRDFECKKNNGCN